MEAVRSSNGWEFPPFYPGMWVFWNVLGLIFYAFSNGYWSEFSLASINPWFPPILFMIGSAIQNYLLGHAVLKIKGKFARNR